jgi:gamma-glutamyl-gamma-aminobutyrate hydrolase PuuD
MKRKIYIVGGGEDYACWMEGVITREMAKADLVVFTGGEDVDPSFYNQEKHPFTSSNILRDRREVVEFKRAKELGKPMIGICRGSQLLCVMNGGKLVQHQENPFFIHRLKMYDGEEILISSTHHQAAYPFDMPKKKYKILGWTNSISPIHHGESWLKELNPPVECEVMYYPKFRCLGIQGHPEMLFERKGYETSVAYFRALLDKFLANKIRVKS